MKGLLFKDLLNLKGNVRILVVFLGLFLLFNVMPNGASAAQGFSSGMMTILCGMIPMSSMSFDELCGWDRLCLAMPVDRKTVVLSKYLLGVGLSSGLMVILSVISTISAVLNNENPLETLLANLVLFCISILLLSLVMPFMFRYGSEKARYVMMGFALVPFAIVMLLSQLNIAWPTITFGEELFVLLPLMAVVLCILLFLISINISIRIYEKKEI